MVPPLKGGEAREEDTKIPQSQFDCGIFLHPLSTLIVVEIFLGVIYSYKCEHDEIH